MKKGEDFGELAKRYSEGQTAKQGGDMGAFERGQLPKPLEDQVFKMNANDLTDVIQTKAGFEIMQSGSITYQAGQQPIRKSRKRNHQYILSPTNAARSCAAISANCAKQSYVTIKPGYVDSAAVGGNSWASKK